ncbi:type VI secretion system TssO [Aquimarina sp. 2201CG5-10]|uniref:type VI secretion system TssO n=1 Tax=Aquimarina callyspongiae TaxID=3098150 RepID=UPI002AB3412A|nr:type VI secretion system TssO [Aquimarina sp. 2201CG5-10]MDY8138347.1 type VI secretion system TssO [Aquimarina sp. 2201CG5-10]
MKPKNSKERRNSILKFFLLFLFTTALIVTAFYFDFDRIPFKENAVWRERSALIEKEMQFQEKFSEGMIEVKSLIDSLDTPGQNLQYINALINSKIVDLQKSIPKEDSTYRYDMYTNIVNSYVDIQALKTKLKEFDDVDERIEEYQEELDKVRQELNEANRYLDALRR